MIKNILLDLDDTILDFHKAEHIALGKTFESFGLEPEQNVFDRYSEINLWHWKQLELGKMTREEVLFGRFRQLLTEFGIDIPAEEAQQLYEKNLGIGHYFMPGALEALTALQNKGYRLYIVSNGTATVQYSRMKSADIEKYFEALFISQEIGYEKPSLKFFERAFETIPDFDKKETVIIGDSLTSDIRGGNNAGIRTIWFNPWHRKNETTGSSSPAEPDHEIDGWNGIWEILDNM